MDRLVNDPIPNIRFNVAKSYAVLIDTLRRLPDQGTLKDVEGHTSNGPNPRGQELINNSIMPNLEKLQQDSDADVRYFATTAASGKPSTLPEVERMDTEQ
jgi:serine/threonine-protein phosphatase 2A regulatory subunit A